MLLASRLLRANVLLSDGPDNEMNIKMPCDLHLGPGVKPSAGYLGDVVPRS